MKQKETASEELIGSSSKSSGEVQLKQLQLNSLLQITEAINQNFSKTQLLSIYEFVLRNQLKVSKLLLFTFDTQWEISLIYGVSSGVDPDLIAEKLSHIREKKPVLITETGTEFEDIIPVYHKDKALAYAFIGKGSSANNYKEDILPFIQTISNLVIVALENKKLAKDFIKQAGVKKELALAAEMQSMLFPSKLPHLDNVDMSALYLPHQEVGGDYYDFIRISEHEFITCMADVSGKGIPAALLMSNFQATLHALARNSDSLTVLLEQLNRSVIRSAKGEKFITLFICKFNTQTRELKYINAGHNPPLLYSSNTNKIHLLEEGSVGLGMFEKLPFISTGEMVANEGTEYILLCYTDGIIELENDNGEAYGIERLQKFLMENNQVATMNILQKKLLTELTEFKENRPFVDDVTLLISRCRF